MPHLWGITALSQHPFREIHPFFELRKSLIAGIDGIQPIVHNSKVLTKLGKLIRRGSGLNLALNVPHTDPNYWITQDDCGGHAGQWYEDVFHILALCSGRCRLTGVGFAKPFEILIEQPRQHAMLFLYGVPKLPVREEMV